MADSTAKRGGHAEFHEGDPFAELTRIMGSDPRQQYPADHADYGDLSLDLESELLGDLDLSDEKQDGAQVAASARSSDEGLAEVQWREEPELAHDAEPAPVQYAPMRDDQVPTELDLGDFEDEFASVFDGRLDEEPALPPEEPVQDAVTEVPAFLGAQPVPFRSPPEEQPLPPGERSAADLEDSNRIADPGHEARRGETMEEQGARDFLPDEIAPMESLPEDYASAALDDFDFDALVNDLDAIDMDFGAAEAKADPLDAAFAPEEAEVVPGDEKATSADKEIAPENEEAAPVHEAAHAVTSDGPSLEDELERLLSRGASMAVDAGDATEPAQMPEEDAEADKRPRDMAAHAAPVAVAAGTAAAASWAPPGAEVSGFETMVPDTSEATAEPAAPDVETIEMADFEPARPEPLEVPELPVEESVQPQSDFDDLTAELNQAFEFMDQQEPASDVGAWDAAAGDHLYDPASDAEFDWENVAVAAAADANGHVAKHNATDRDAYPDHRPPEREFAEFSRDTSEGIAMAPTGARPRLYEGRNRKVAIAASVAALALLVGYGAHALWWSGGSGEGEPILLQADSDPVRIRPEDPGGTVVPNQDNQVYQRVAGGQDEAEPSQERLINTAEEPVDLTADDPQSRLGSAAAATEADTQELLETIKSGERLDAAASESEQAPNDDAITLQPRRVRTMVVRPDGSIVPREETEAASASDLGAGVMAQESSPSTELSSNDVPLLPVAGTFASEGGLNSAAAEEPESSQPMPEQIALAPASRPENSQQPSPASGQVAPQTSESAATQQQQQQVAAADPTPAPPQATTSEWSMQIASQPSAESAQTTYQQLARQHSSLLEGRGVNIVRAEVEGRTYYRVRIPMPSRDEAVTLCTRYQQAGGSCFVSR